MSVAAARLLAELDTLGIISRVDGARVLLKPIDQVPPDLLAALRAHKLELVALLTCHCGQPLAGNKVECSACVERAYAACEQQTHPSQPVIVRGDASRANTPELSLYSTRR